MLCETCEKRESCSELCPEAESYVNQDYVALTELPIPIENIEHGKIEWPENKGGLTICLSKTEDKISKMLKKEFSPQEISYLLDISIQTVYNNICSLRKKHNNN